MGKLIRSLGSTAFWEGIALALNPFTAMLSAFEDQQPRHSTKRMFPFNRYGSIQDGIDQDWAAMRKDWEKVARPHVETRSSKKSREFRA